MRKWIFAACLSLSSALACAAVEVTQLTVREVLPGRSMTAGYFSLSNKTDKAVELTGASSPLFGAIELHQHSHKDGMMKMEQVESVSVAAGETVTFAPGGLHLMLFDLKSGLTVGQTIALTLQFKDGTAMELQALVSAVPAN